MPFTDQKVGPSTVIPRGRSSDTHSSRRIASLVVLCTAIGIAAQIGRLGMTVEEVSAPDKYDFRHPICRCGQLDLPLRRHEAIVELACTIDHGSALALEFFAVEGRSARQIRRDNSTLSPNFHMDVERTKGRLPIGLCLQQIPSGVSVSTAADTLGRCGCQPGDALVMTSVRYRQVFAGDLSPDRQRMLFVAGDSPIFASPEMSVEDFARAHPGTYVVCFGRYTQPRGGRRTRFK
jgi:hypothetical protein